MSGIPVRRSEEHTSELQSCRDLVCRLLLEKKKKTQNMAAEGIHVHITHNKRKHKEAKFLREKVTAVKVLSYFYSNRFVSLFISKVSLLKKFSKILNLNRFLIKF